MRALILLLPLAVAFAGDPAPLEEAAKQWANDSAEVRDVASRAVAIELRRQLAPLIAAMRSDDPEVRRRAAAAIEGLLPPRPPEPRTPEQAQGQALLFVRGGGGGGQIRVVMNAQGQAVLLGQDQGDVQQLKARGIGGYAVDDPLLREQLGLAEGRGFAVTELDARSEADRLGIKAMDILLSIDGRPVKQPGQVLQGLSGAKAEIKVMRRGKLVTLVGKEGVGASGEGR